MTPIQAETFLLSLMNLPRQEYMEDTHRCRVYLLRMQALLDLLGNPEKKIPHVIHVAGTSGKGSVCAYLESILHTAGYRVAKLESPSPDHITHRWRIGMSPMPKTVFADIVARLKPILDIYTRTSGYDMVSYAELMTVIGLIYFAESNIDWLVLETGCGGRYDSTNIIPKKDIAVITSIGLDHTHILGKTKKIIAQEKAGIITPNSHVFVLPIQKSIHSIIADECTRQHATLHTMNDVPKDISISLEGTTFSYHKTRYQTQAIGAHQASNAVGAIEIALSLGIDECDIVKGIRTTKLPLRMQVVHNNPVIILDGAHNQDKIASTVHSLIAIRSPKQKIHLVFGLCHDKPLIPIVRALSIVEPATFSCTRSSINTTRMVHDPKKIAEAVRRYMPKTKTNVFLDAHDAQDWSLSCANKNDLVVVTGSFFLASELA